MCNPDFLRLGVPGRDEAGDRLPKRGDDGTDCVASDFLDKMLMALPRHNRLELIALPVIIVTHGKVKNTKNTGGDHFSIQRAFLESLAGGATSFRALRASQVN